MSHGDDNSQAGRIVFLNGTSSAGKTTLSLALQDHLADPWLHFALDQFRDGLPSRFRGLNAPPDTEGARGLNVVPVTDGAFPYTSIVFGDVGQTMLRGMHRAVRALADTGNNLIIDDILLDADILDDYLSVLDGIDVRFVGVMCDADTLDQRENARAGRFPGTARGMLDQVHRDVIYDLTVDTASEAPAACAARVAAMLDIPWSERCAAAQMRVQRRVSAVGGG